ncbi:succinate dehydrogenase subunit C [Propioniferax innocua]|uniref:Succinate dehydrogenase subunit C n=1 Tax=Propioniferax innocua TaxID=1753 RepID=A0A542ZPH1_9ACTN|nr:succinate dehydrogenase subunit C [Propioniferax innocua]
MLQATEAGRRIPLVATTTQPSTLTARQKALKSTVIAKFVMAGSGILMALFLLVHMYGNLKVFAGKTADGQWAFDVYAHHLRVMGEPILPPEGLLWITRVVLLVAVIAHFASAFKLWARAKKAVGGKRYASGGRVQRSYASYTMRWGGVVILLFIIAHILQFTTHTIDTWGGDAAASTPFERLVLSFQNPLVLIAYVIAIIAVGLHLTHGLWSAFATLGANTGAKARANLNKLAVLIALVIVVGFLAGPFAIFFGGITL